MRYATQTLTCGVGFDKPDLRMHLYETHVPVTDTTASETFYREVVGLPFAYRDPTRDIVFLWVDEKEKGMIGLWGASTGYGRQNGEVDPIL